MDASLPLTLQRYGLQLSVMALNRSDLGTCSGREGKGFWAIVVDLSRPSKALGAVGIACLTKLQSSLKSLHDSRPATKDLRQVLFLNSNYATRYGNGVGRI